MTQNFEETYPRYPFAGLVGLGLALAALAVRVSAKHQPASAARGVTPEVR